MQTNISIGLIGRLFSVRSFRAACAGLLVLAGAATQLHAQEVLSVPFQGAAAPISGGSSSLTLGFDIQLNFINTPSPSAAADFAAAEATWESIIVGYKESDIANTIVNIDVNLAPIDGPGGILGSAGPSTGKLNAAQNAVSPTFLYTQTGVMNFDTADILNLGSAFKDVVLHEMAHVLGIGTLWSASAAGPFPGRQEHYVNNSGQYTGPFGLAAYNSEFSQAGAFVPVELGGGAGTANGHWNEVNGGAGLTGIVSNIEPGPNNDMRNELMTGWLNAPSFISTLTVQSFMDLGYAVVPEPSTLLLGGVGLVALVARRRQAA